MTTKPSIMILRRRMYSGVRNGGHLAASFKTAAANEYLKVYHNRLPHILCECFGITYSQFTSAENVKLTKGMATYIGTFLSENYLREILKDCITKAELPEASQDLSFPIIVRKGSNDEHNQITYFFNYSVEEKSFPIRA